ncbi:hypothetical protein TSOC_000822 [Tetrabaena socialis]|uniref:Uncharacterized protein n=1 Tax=Tetrabaena socialis TaxID=47790 RepID=A0A2J8AIA7_9CHLO|nr:hypothetical protein TSOC_000822 [Tetrabaena socialis]|eukprot:PNH12246.1 hypothetical protein TSOC_000822 [Tetrabaena socialis]
MNIASVGRNAASLKQASQPRPMVPAPSTSLGLRRTSGCARPAARPLHHPPRAATPTPTVPGQYVTGGDGDPEMVAFQESQQAALRPSAAEEARTVLDQGK